MPTTGMNRRRNYTRSTADARAYGKPMSSKEGADQHLCGCRGACSWMSHTQGRAASTFLSAARYASPFLCQPQGTPAAARHTTCYRCFVPTLAANLSRQHRPSPQAPASTLPSASLPPVVPFPPLHTRPPCFTAAPPQYHCSCCNNSHALTLAAAHSRALEDSDVAPPCRAALLALTCRVCDPDVSSSTRSRSCTGSSSSSSSSSSHHNTTPHACSRRGDGLLLAMGAA
jgi:hypothetical protein